MLTALASLKVVGTWMIEFLNTTTGRILIGLLILSLAFVYTYKSGVEKGRAEVTAEWEIEKTQTTNKIDELTKKSEKISTEVRFKYIDRVKTIHVRGAEIVNTVTNVVTPEVDQKCEIPVNFIVLHNMAVNNTEPEVIK